MPVEYCRAIYGLSVCCASRVELSDKEAASWPLEHSRIIYGLPVRQFSEVE